MLWRISICFWRMDRWISIPHTSIFFTTLRLNPPAPIVKHLSINTLPCFSRAQIRKEKKLPKPQCTDLIYITSIWNTSLNHSIQHGSREHDTSKILPYPWNHLPFCWHHANYSFSHDGRLPTTLCSPFSWSSMEILGMYRINWRPND